MWEKSCLLVECILRQLPPILLSNAFSVPPPPAAAAAAIAKSDKVE